MNLQRSESLLTGKANLEELSSINKFPVFIGATDKPMESDIFSDLTFDICKDTGFIQLRNLVDPNIVYSQFHSEAIGKVWEDHREVFAKLVSKYSKEKSVIELGGSDSKLAIKCLDNVKKWTIIDPNLENKIENPKLNYIEDFFSFKKLLNVEKNLIVHSHVFEHVLTPIEFLAEISFSLRENDYHIFSVPNLHKYMKNKYVNTVNFEHTVFLTEPFIDYLLSYSNFKIVDKIYFQEHSIFYVTQKSKYVKPKKTPNKYNKYKKLYLDCYNYYREFVENLNKELENTNKTVYLFGGHVFSQYLIALGLNTSKIRFILDNSKIKNGKRLYGTPLYIRSPFDVTLDENTMIILKVGQYKDEIKTQLLNINKNIFFYE